MKNERRMKANFEYDNEDDVLYVYNPNSKIKQTIEVEEFLNMDLDKQNNIVGLEFFDLAKLNKEASKKFLLELSDVEIIQRNMGRNNFFLIISLKSKSKVVEQPTPLFSYKEYKSPLLESC